MRVRLITQFMLGVLLFSSACDKDVLIPSESLPVKIQAFIQQHFPNQQIIQSIKDRDGLSKNYDVWLDNSISLEFNQKGEVMDIEGNVQLPDSVIPVKVLDFVQSNHPQQFITGWERAVSKGHKIELNNDLELNFTAGGDFLRIDD